jgi:hypothetical protein
MAPDSLSNNGFEHSTSLLMPTFALVARNTAICVQAISFVGSSDVGRWEGGKILPFIRVGLFEGKCHQCQSKFLTP